MLVTCGFSVRAVWFPCKTMLRQRVYCKVEDQNVPHSKSELEPTVHLKTSSPTLFSSLLSQHSYTLNRPCGCFKSQAALRALVCLTAVWILRLKVYVESP